MRLFFVSCVLLLFTAVGITAQEDTEAFNRLPELLALTPDTDASREFFSFADYEAMTLARPDAERPPNNEAYESDEPQYEAWWSAFLGIRSGISLANYLITWFDEGDEYMGFTFFDTNASVEYGIPPERVQLFVADYDSDNVIATHEDRDYTITEEDDYTLICSENGCDAGSQVNIDARLRGYVFGGDLGREQPVLMTNNDVILSSTGLPEIEEYIELIEDDIASLADDPDYAAIAEVASIDVDVVIQGDIRPVTQITMSNTNDTDNNIPAYDVLAIIDGATTTQQVVRIMVVYDNEDHAQQASDELAVSIAEFTFGSNSVSLEELIEERGATYGINVMSTDNQERYVTVIELHAPLETELDNPSGQIYQLLYQLIDAGNTAWLTPNSAEE